MSQLDDILAASLPGPLKDFFGDAATYTPALAPSTPYALTVIKVDPQPQETTFPGSVTAVEVVVADMSAAPVKGDKITINSIDYSVFDITTDSIGFARLALRVKRT